MADPQPKIRAVKRLLFSAFVTGWFACRTLDRLLDADWLWLPVYVAVTVFLVRESWKRADRVAADG